MTRREWLAICGAASLGANQVAPKDYPGIRYRDYSRVLPDYLRGLAAKSYMARNAEIAKLDSAGTIEARQQWARNTFWDLIGGKLEKTPLKVRVTGSFERAKYRVEKLIYESRPNFHVSANLYIPKGVSGPYPGVLFQMGHALNGKASPTYQRCCQGLVQLGYIVLGFDPMGQGERVYYPDASGIKTRFGSADDEHTYPGRQMLLTGDSSTRTHVWDAVRSLDVLISHPLVDPKRVASTGQSGGGTVTMFLMGVDDRLAAAAVCSGNTENFISADFNPPGPVDDAEQNFPGSGPLGWDRWDTMYPFAPKPLLISVSHKDFFGTYSPRYITSGWEEFKKLQRVYEVMGKRDQIAWDGTGLPHGLSYDTRLLVYNWFARWLKNEQREIAEEPTVTLEMDELLWATKSGNVVQEYRGATPFLLNRARKLTRNSVSIEQLLAISKPEVRVTRFDAEPLPGAQVHPIEIASEAGIHVQAWQFEPRGVAVRGSLVLVQASRSTGFREEELFHQLARAGIRVLIPDVRGTGDLTPEFGRGAARHARDHNSEESWAWASMSLGKPLLGQRVTDIQASVAALGVENVTLAAHGRMTVPALIAAALEPSIKTLYLAGGLVSWRSIVESDMYDHSLANFVRGVLNHTDLPEIANGVKAKIILAGAVGATGRAMPASEVRKIYPDSRRIEIRGDAAWDSKSIGGLVIA